MAILNRDLKFKNDVGNADILNAIRKNASYDYQRRIPAATKATIKETLQALVDNRPFWNEFTHELINRIGMEIYKSKSWNNPLARFKIGQLEFGDTIEEIMVGLIDAKTYDPSREYMEKELFGTTRPEVQTSFHKVNRRNYYPITVNEPLLQQAFVNNNGLASFIAQVMEAPATSDNYDEFLLMTSLFADYHANGGFFNVQVPDFGLVASDAQDARYAIRRVKEMAGRLPYLSRHYNAAGMPAFANPDDLVIFITPGANAAIDVEALAAAFNIDKAAMPGRKIIIPDEYMAITGCQMIVTTSDFFVIADQLFRTDSQWNPAGLSMNYFLHHWQVISYSRFVPAIMFSTAESTVIAPEAITVNNVAAPDVVDHDFAKVTEVERGMSYAADTTVGIVPEDIGAVVWAVDGNKSEKTYITQTGTLYVARDESAESLTVVATSVHDATKTVSSTVTVTGDILRIWPDPDVIEPVEPTP